jgi:hypothetical protein
MARSAIVVTPITRVGVAPGAQTVADSVNKHYFVNADRVYLEVISTDVGAQTVGIEFAPSATVDGVTPPAKSIAVPAGVTRLVGPFPAVYYNQPASQVFIDPSVSTTLQFRAYQLPAQ